MHTKETVNEQMKNPQHDFAELSTQISVLLGQSKSQSLEKTVNVAVAVELAVGSRERRE